MRISIFGVGAVGGHFGARLAQVNPDISFIARGETLKALFRDGLRVESISGGFHIYPVKATADPKQIGSVDFVLLTVKAWQVPEAAEMLSPMIGSKTGVIFLGNGVEAHEQLTSILGKEHVLGGLCRISAYASPLGTIRHVGINPTVVMGELDNQLTSRLEGLKKEFEKARVEIQIPEDILTAIWQKFIFVAAMSGIGALTRSPIGVIRGRPETRRLLESAIDEIISVASAKGINLTEDQSAKTLAFIDGLDPSATASMQRDIMDGKPSELEHQNGAVVRLGNQLGVEIPVNQFIYSCLLPQELSARDQLPK
jgi:2-dehydropantoate 2-reductase